MPSYVTLSSFFIGKGQRVWEAKKLQSLSFSVSRFMYFMGLNDVAFQIQICDPMTVASFYFSLERDSDLKIQNPDHPRGGLSGGCGFVGGMPRQRRHTPNRSSKFIFSAMTNPNYFPKSEGVFRKIFRQGTKIKTRSKFREENLT